MPIDDPGLLYGATVFTTLRVYYSSLDSGLTNWAGHCLRLLTTIQTFNWQPPEWNRIRQGAELLIPHFPVLRITLFPDGREWITGRSLPNDLTQRQKHGVAAWIAAHERSLPAHKTGNYLSAWMAKTTAQQVGTSEAIFVANGNWLETTTGNLWGWLDGCWWTPPVDGRILPGVVRSQLVNWLKSHNCPVIEKPWLPDIVKRFEAIAYTNSVVEVIPIHTVIEPRRGRNEEPAGATVNQLKYDPYHPCFQLLRKLFNEPSII